MTNINLTQEKQTIKSVTEPNKAKFKYFPSSVREWKNSIYLYNQNNINLIPSTTVNAMRIIKSFFTFYNDTLERKARTKRLLRRFRKLSSNRIYLSKGEFKHNNNSVLINLYVFNKEKLNYLSNLKRNYLKEIITKKVLTKKKNKRILKLLKFIYTNGLDSIKEVNKNKYTLIRALEKSKKYKIKTFKSISNYTTLFYKKVLKLKMKKLSLYFLYKQLIYLNKSKLNYIYLKFLKKRLENLYNKNVEFNIINLKRFYLNSDILSESVKLKITQDRSKTRRILVKLKNKVKLYKTNIFFSPKRPIKNKLSKFRLKRRIFDNLKYRHVSGFRLEVKGRITRRFTASRSRHKLKYNGNLLGLDSSYRKVSSVILKGNLRSNLQYTKLKSKTRIGSFGIKGWVNGY